MNPVCVCGSSGERRRPAGQPEGQPRSPPRREPGLELGAGADHPEGRAEPPIVFRIIS